MPHLNILTTVLVVIFINLSFSIETQALLDDLVQINITQGTLRGRSLTTEAGVNYYSFQGIPYAKPPIGELRFKAPQPPMSWEGVRDGTEPGYSVCPQNDLYDPNNIIGNEDCLFLNVYTTQLPTDDGKSPELSVMVWIHGGAFSIGSGNTGWYGPDFLINNEDIVLVTINYRLGVLGFLGLNHSDVSKNNGLKDQVAALHWVHSNIDKFGGNPNDVTIFGESAGAVSVHLQILSPLSEGLFHKAISQSGSALNFVSYIDPSMAHEIAMSLADVLSYNTSDISEVLKYLLKTDAYSLVNAGNLVPNSPTMPKTDGVSMMFGATIETTENSFLPDIPLNIIRSGKFHQVPYITGANSAEAKALGLGLLANRSQFEYYNQNFEMLFVPAQLNLEVGSTESLQVAAEIRETYFGNESISENTIVEFVNLESDYGMVSGIYRTIEEHLSITNTPLYFYTFSYVGKLSFFEITYSGNYSLPGAAHGDDIGYLFKMYDFNITTEKDSEELQIVQHMTRMWTNFAKTGYPSLDSVIIWNPVNENSTYLNIDKHLTVYNFTSFEHSQMALWSKLFKKATEDV